MTPIKGNEHELRSTYSYFLDKSKKLDDTPPSVYWLLKIPKNIDHDGEYDLRMPTSFTVTRN